MKEDIIRNWDGSKVGTRVKISVFNAVDGSKLRGRVNGHFNPGRFIIPDVILMVSTSPQTLTNRFL